MSLPADQTPSAERPRRTFWFRGPGIIAIIVIVGLILFGVTALLGQRSRDAAERDLKVEVDRCLFNEGGAPSVQVGATVTNSGGSAHSATLEMEYRDMAGHRVGTGRLRVPSVPAGDSVRVEGVSRLDVAEMVGTCHVTGIS